MEPLVGSSGNDNIRGTGRDDTIYGLAGNDSLHSDAVRLSGRGARPERLIVFEDNPIGGTGNDTIYGTGHNDTIYGLAGNDSLHGGVIRLRGRGGRPARLVSGHDNLIGGTGNDTLVGHLGNDTLNGAGSSPFGDNSRGVNEIDRLTGEGNGITHLERDLFVLGDNQGAYYVGGGRNDYAVITDFTSVDQIQLNGDSSRYRLGTTDGVSTQGTGIFFETPNGGRDLIAVVQGAASGSLDLNSNQFVYV